MNGENFTLPVVGTGSIHNIYEFFDKPILFSVNSETGYYIFSLISSRSNIDTWIFAPCTYEKLLSIENGQASLFQYFSAFSDKVVSSVIISENTVEHRYLNKSEVSAEILPSPDYYINLHEPSFAEVEPRTFAQAIGLTIVNLRATPLDGHKSTIAIKQLGLFLQNFQEALDNIAMNLLGNQNPRGRIPIAISNQTTLEYAAGFNSSVGISLISSDETILVNGTLADSLETLGNLIQSRGNVLPLMYQLAERNRQISDRTLLKFKGMMISLNNASSGISLEWSDKSGRSGAYHADANEVRVALHEISKHINSTERIITIIGRFSSGDIDTHRFKIVDIETGNHYNGYSEDSMERLGIQIQLGKNYQALLRETTSLNEVTGQEASSYSLISLKELEV